MKMWESALLNYFKNKYGIIDAEYLAMDPTWVKVMQVRSSGPYSLLVKKIIMKIFSRDKEGAHEKRRVAIDIDQGIH